MQRNRQPVNQPPAAQEDAGAYWLTALLVVVALSLVMGLPRLLGFTRQSPLVTLFLLLPLVLVALRFKLRGVMLATLLLDGGLVLLVALLGQQDAAMQYQLVMVAIALMGLWLGGTVEALDRVMLRLQDFSSISNDLLWETTSAGVLSMGGRLAAQLAYQTGDSWRTVLTPDSQPCLATLEQAIESRQAFSNLEVAVHTHAGATLWLRVTGIPLRDMTGEHAGFRGTATNISDAVKVKELLLRYNRELLTEVAQRTAELHRSNAELAVKEQHMRVLLAAVPVGVMELDESDRCCYLNANGSTLMDCPMEQAQGLPLLDFVHPDDYERVQQVWRDSRPLDAVQTLEFRLRRNNTWCAAYWIKFHHTDEWAARTIMVLVDSTLQHEQAEQLWGMAHTDLLTGLPNRNLFLDRCTQVLTLAKRMDMGAALFWIDLDGFKSVNDSLGHAAGDAMLREVAQRLLSRLRDSDTAARIGGDEFAVIMTDVSGTDTVLRLANELVASLRQPYDLPQGRAQISASIGIAHYPLHADTVETLMRFADGAMYRAKHAGKDQVRVWGAEYRDARDIPTQY
jgi:diguanylate cyclase (GGDEF)-like protein